MRLAGCAAGIDYVNALGFPGGDGVVSVANSPKKCTVFLLKAVLIFVGTSVLMLAVAASRALDRQVNVVVQQDGQVGLKVATQHFVQLQHGLRSQLAAAALVGFGGVGEAVAEDDAPLGQRGKNYLVNMLCARGEHQCHFGGGRQAGGCRVEQDVANLFAGGSAARLAGDDHGNASGTESARELGDLRALAAAVEAFEGDELSARRHVGNDSRLRTRSEPYSLCAKEGRPSGT